MQRLRDHFCWSSDLLAASPEHVLAAEQPQGRPVLEAGRFCGLPIWFHDGCDRGLSTDDGRHFDPDDAIACLQFEHYVGKGGDAERGLKSIYYRLKPFLPRALQLQLQRVNANRRLRAVRFPTWPQDSTLVDLFGALLVARMREAGIDRLPFIGFWPHGRTWAWCLTHDVDTAVGYAHVEPLARVEDDRGLVSAWYFVPERYRWDRAKLDELRGRGHEIGVHGLDHSGKLFASRADFEWRRDRINRYVAEWNVRGFRSPSTYRNPYWISEIEVDYDSSFLDVATFEPQRGGVTAPFPFFLDARHVELPMTLPMDHTLKNVLRQDVFDACRRKADWVRDQHGLALALFHPDYNTRSQDRDAYARLLDSLAGEETAWFATPVQVADWWARRRRSQLRMNGVEAVIAGPAAADGRVWWAHLDGERLQIEPPT